VIETALLFRPLGTELISLLRSLSPEDWARPTSATPWSVKDVIAHMLDTDLRRLSSHRDGHRPPPDQEVSTYADLVSFLNRLNQTWVEATGRLSPRVLLELLNDSSRLVAELFEAADPRAPGVFSVAWAGEESSLMWFDIAREYTERWHHQDQIREAVGVLPLGGAYWLRPVLETSLLALPHAYRGTSAPAGTSILLQVGGDAGGEWTLEKQDSWAIRTGPAAAPVCTVVTSDLDMCRLLMHRLDGPTAERVVSTDGPAELVAPLLSARAVIV
jgi:uncharacterized protein (TIGR03083 family)